MKFIVDAHLPSGICSSLVAAGHDALHTTNLPTQNRTSDEAINQLSINEHRVVVSKDTDFLLFPLIAQKTMETGFGANRQYQHS